MGREAEIWERIKRDTKMALIISLDEYKCADVIHRDSGQCARIQVRDAYEVRHDKYGRYNHVINRDEETRTLRGIHLHFDDPFLLGHSLGSGQVVGPHA